MISKISVVVAATVTFVAAMLFSCHIDASRHRNATLADAKNLPNRHLIKDVALLAELQDTEEGGEWLDGASSSKNLAPTENRILGSKSSKSSKSSKGSSSTFVPVNNDPLIIFKDLEPDARDLAITYYNYPSSLQERISGVPSSSGNEYPVYELLGWDDSTGPFMALNPDTGDDVPFTVVEKLYGFSDFIDEFGTEETFNVQDSMGISVVFAKIGSPAEEVIAVVLSFEDEDENPYSTLVVFRESFRWGYSEVGFGAVYTTFPPATGRSLLSMSSRSVTKKKKPAETNVEESTIALAIDSFLRESVCKGFLRQALDAYTCPSADEIVLLDDQCVEASLGNLQGPFSQNLQQYNEAVEAAEDERSQNIVDFAKSVYERVVRSNVQSFRIGYCDGDSCNRSTGRIRRPRESFNDFTEEWAEEFLRRELTEEESTRRVQLDNGFKDAVASAKEALEIADIEYCPDLVNSAGSCFNCFVCDTSLVECCENSDCSDSSLSCVSNVCVGRGRPRFTLTWFGDDDLDIHVVTPGGFEIYYVDTIDPLTGGFLDKDDIPGSVDEWVENILFPDSAPLGTYTVFVDPYDVSGLPDSWELSVFMDPTLVATYTGSASDSPTQMFTFDLTQDQKDSTENTGCPSMTGQEAATGNGGSCFEVPPVSELTWVDIIDDARELQGGTSGVQRVVYVDVDLIPQTKAYEDDPFWWKYYRSFWDEEGTEFVDDGELFEQGRVGDDCFGLEWYTRNTVSLRSPSTSELYSTRYCVPVSEIGTNDLCQVFLSNHYRGRIGDLVPDAFTLGPTYRDPRSRLPGVAMNFEIFLDEYVQVSEERFQCYGAGFWRSVIPGEVTKDGWGIVPQIDEPQGRTDAPFFQWIFVVPKGKSVRIGRCLPTAIGCSEVPRNVGDALILDPPLSQISDDERKRREIEKFLRLIEEGQALGSGIPGRVRRSDKEKIGFYYQFKDPLTGKWQSTTEPFSLNNLDAVKEIIQYCNCLTINGSGNKFEDGLNGGIAMADKAGRTENIHLYMPVSIGPAAYLLDNRNTMIPAVLGELADWAFDNGIRLDLRGHSWSGWLLWRACAENSSRMCEGMKVTTYNPATMPNYWDDLQDHFQNFLGEGYVVLGSKDHFVSKPSLGVYFNFNRPPDFFGPSVATTEVESGHKLVDTLDACNGPNCRRRRETRRLGGVE